MATRDVTRDAVSSAGAFRHGEAARFGDSPLEADRGDRFGNASTPQLF